MIKIISKDIAEIRKDCIKKTNKIRICYDPE